MTEPVFDDGFSVVFSSYSADVLRFARRRVDSDDAAWDVVSDTFTSAWRNWSRRPGDDALLPWLYAIAANATRDRHRAAGRQRRLVSRLSMLQPETPGPDLAEEPRPRGSRILGGSPVVRADWDDLHWAGQGRRPM